MKKTATGVEYALGQITLEYVDEYMATPRDGSKEFGEWSELNEALFSGARAIDVPGLGILEGVDEFGGMDQGSERWMIFKLTQEDGTTQHFQKDGCYASHDGTYWDGELFEVSSRTKTVECWDRVDG